MASDVHLTLPVNPALLTAAAGMKARLETLDVLANNLANASTAGYKADAEFYRLFAAARARPDPRTGDGDPMPVVEASATDFRAGPIEETGSPFDIALAGPGFLRLQGPAGDVYTRQGSLIRAPDGRLLGPNGLVAADAEGKPIVLPPNGAVEIAANGLVRVDGQAAGSLVLVEFDNPRALRKAGDALFAAPEEAGVRPAAATAVRQGALEGSNVNPSLSAVRLLSAGRHFELLRRVSTLVGDEMDGRAVAELGRSS